MTAKAVEKFTTSDEKQNFKGNGVVVIETGLSISN